MYKKITKNVSVTVLDDRVYLHLKKYRPVVINADDKFRKGVEIRICSKCKSVTAMALWNGNTKRNYCGECAIELFKRG